MKSLIILVFCAVVVSADLASERLKLKKHQTECETKLGEPKNMLEKMAKGEDLGDMEKAGKMALCINTEMGQMNENGEMIPEKFKEHVDNLTENLIENMRKRMIDGCGKKHGSTAEEAAMNFVRCMTNVLPHASPSDFTEN
ncbi:unnamed protein product [Phyllotreta striolata]|uniref:Uncharacterized protein n=1 Tax=Phyllotreta striolata TaxID=444603 RepID=A0A9N9TXW5_PHYSR|nr:unnamed protein product [Phyllotreta striolata]